MLQELGVGDIDDDYRSFDEENEGNVEQTLLPPYHSKLGTGSNYLTDVPAHSMQPSGFHHGQQEVQHFRIGNCLIFQSCPKKSSYS